MIETNRDAVARPTVWWWLLVVLSVGVGAYAAGFAVVGAEAFYEGRDPAIGREAASVAIAVHAVFGTVALGLSPFQFLAGPRRRRPSIHRSIGRVAVVGGILTGLSGLFVAAFAEGGTIGRVGFALLGVLTAMAGIVAWRRILAGDVDAHRAWMVRSFALLLAAVSLRLQVPVLLGIFDGDPTPVFAIVGWSSWLPNAVVAEWLVVRGRAGRALADPHA